MDLDDCKSEKGLMDLGSFQKDFQSVVLSKYTANSWKHVLFLHLQIRSIMSYCGAKLELTAKFYERGHSVHPGKDMNDEVVKGSLWFCSVPLELCMQELNQFFKCMYGNTKRPGKMGFRNILRFFLKVDSCATFTKSRVSSKVAKIEPYSFNNTNFYNK